MKAEPLCVDPLFQKIKIKKTVDNECSSGKTDFKEHQSF